MLLFPSVLVIALASLQASPFYPSCIMLDVLVILIDGHIIHEVLPQRLDSIGIKFSLLKAFLAIISILGVVVVTLGGFFALGLFLQLMK